MFTSLSTPLARIQFKALLLAPVLSLTLVDFYAHADTEKNKTYISVDYHSRQMKILGFFNQKTDSKQVVDGLTAELEARKNGITTLSDYLKSSCEDKANEIKNEEVKMQPTWKTSLRSQGSEIYSNGVLKIILSAHLTDIFKIYSSTKLKLFKAADGVPVTFHIPKIPLPMLKCGVVKLSLTPNMNIFVAPIRANEPDSEAKVIPLSVLKGESLQVVSQSDIEFLKKSNLSGFESDSQDSWDMSKGIVALPVSGN